MRRFPWVIGFSLTTLLSLQVLPSPVRACVGDCSGTDVVTRADLVTGINIAVANATLYACSQFDGNIDHAVTVDEILTAVNAVVTAVCPAPSITTVAGSGLAGFTGDGLDPLNTALYLPQDTTVGPEGRLYIVDWNNHRIRRISNGLVQTVAGSGDIGDAKDGLALYAQFNHPTQVFFDPNGDMLIAAWHNSQVKRLHLAADLTQSTLMTVAGTGARSFGGDGKDATKAALNLPSSVIVDSHGDIVISDQANFRLRAVDSTGTINTTCGKGTPGFSGDHGPAEAAELNAPVGQAAAPAGRITMDRQGRIYVADTNNHAIRMIDDSGMITTIAGMGGQRGFGGDGGPATEALLDTPSDVAVGPNGIVYIADTMNSRVRMITTDGAISTLAGTTDSGFSGDGGRADMALLDRPYGVEVAPNGDVYVADTHNQRIRIVSEHIPHFGPTATPTPIPTVIPCTNQVGSICTYAGNGETAFNDDGRDRLRTALYWPFDIEFTPSGRRIVLDWNNHKVREILPDDTFTTILGSDFVGDGPEDLSDLTPDGAPPLSVNLNHPTDVQEFPGGDIMVMCWHNHKIRVIDHVTGRARVLMGAGAGFAGDNGPPAQKALVNQPPHGVLDPQGNLFFIDQRNQRIRVIYNFSGQRENATVTTVVGNGTKGYNGDGMTLQTEVSFPAGPNPEPSGGLALAPPPFPPGVYGVLYFSDTQNNLIRQVTFFSAGFTNGFVQTIAGTIDPITMTGQAAYGGDGDSALLAQVNYPGDMEIGPDGNLYFADTNNNRVRMINLTTGIIETVAGNGVNGYSGDGGLATAAQLNRPFGVAFDQNRDLYISDTFNSRIRKVKR